MKKKTLSTKRRMQLTFVLGVAFVLVTAEIVMSISEVVFTQTGIISEESIRESPIALVFMWSGISIAIGFVISLLYSRFMFKPVTTLLDGLARLADGDYSTRIEVKEDAVDEFTVISKGVNNLAAELEKTEILRSDFINSFSHEFKTPINSINGLIALVKNEKVSVDKKIKYLDLISEEATRLSQMTTNILNLSKYEALGEISQRQTFNLSEQIRTCVLLLEKKWTAKKLKLSLDFEEFEYFGNEDMLMQVWINLLDNAVKFSDKNGQVSVRVFNGDDSLSVEIGNTGVQISEEDKTRIFNKFYQADSTHSKEGNGIGLSIVKRIVDLHEGKIEVFGEEDKTVFKVILPVNKSAKELDKNY